MQILWRKDQLDSFAGSKGYKVNVASGTATRTIFSSVTAFVLLSCWRQWSEALNALLIFGLGWYYALRSIDGFSGFRSVDVVGLLPENRFFRWPLVRFCCLHSRYRANLLFTPFSMEIFSCQALTKESECSSRNFLSSRVWVGSVTWNWVCSGNPCLCYSCWHFVFVRRPINFKLRPQLDLLYCVNFVVGWVTNMKAV